MAKPLLVRIRNLAHRFVVHSVRLYYSRIWGMTIGRGSRISLRATLDKTNPRGIVIGEYTAVTFGAAILSHDFVNREHKTTRIGSYCFVGAGAVVFPGVTVGDHCIIGVNAVVMRDVPSHSLVMGNPARVIERGIETIAWGLKPKPGDDLPGVDLLGRATPETVAEKET
ncbi:MAG: acyltransferase [Pseudomonadota bacterium]